MIIAITCSLWLPVLLIQDLIKEKIHLSLSLTHMLILTIPTAFRQRNPKAVCLFIAVLDLIELFSFVTVDCLITGSIGNKIKK